MRETLISSIRMAEQEKERIQDQLKRVNKLKAKNIRDRKYELAANRMQTAHKLRTKINQCNGTIRSCKTLLELPQYNEHASIPRSEVKQMFKDLLGR